MDRVRLGRALGRGARRAASTAYEAVAAATAPDPSNTTPGAAATSSRSAATTTPAAGLPSPRASQARPAPHPAASTSYAAPASTLKSPSTRPTTGTLLPRLREAAAATRASKRGMFAPVKRATHAVSLEVTGSFFALFAIVFSVGLWRMRSLLHGGTEDLCRFAAGCVAILIFAYFCVSNFRRARHLQ